MRKIMIALPCLLISGLVSAEQAKKVPAPAAAPKPVETTAADSKRFLMTQNGKQMTADDFEAWMKKNGYRVATGAPAKAKQEEPAKKGSK